MTKSPCQDNICTTSGSRLLKSFYPEERFLAEVVYVIEHLLLHSMYAKLIIIYMVSNFGLILFQAFQQSYGSMVRSFCLFQLYCVSISAI